MKDRWKPVRYRLEWLGVKLALQLVPLLSRVACARIGAVAGSIAFRFDSRGRKVALANLQSAFGDEFSTARRNQIARESYQHFAGSMLDLLWSPRLTERTFTDYIDGRDIVDGPHKVDPSRSCIVGTFHYSNFEWVGLASAWLGFPCAITTQPFKNPLLDGLFKCLREQSGHKVIERDGAIVRLYKTLRKGGRVALLADTTLPPHQPTVVIECFGLKTLVTVAHAWLQDRTGAEILPIHCEPLPHGRFKMFAHPRVALPAGSTHREIAQACWDAIEPAIRANPAPWLWMYKHWRYRPAGAESYPFYAHASPEFEQIAANENYGKLDRAQIKRVAVAATAG